MLSQVIEISRYVLPGLTVLILLLCCTALFKRKAPSLGNAAMINLVNGEVYPLTSRETSLGRHKSCDIVLNYSTVSRQHAVVVCSKNGWYIAKIKAASELLLNGNSVEQKAFLDDGDRITLGSISLTFKNGRQM